jgi:hypothetical protein
MGLWGPTRLYLNKIYKKMYVKGNFFQELYETGRVGQDWITRVHKPLSYIDF